MSLKSGYTFIERSPTGSVENTAFETFDSLAECCAAAEEAANSESAQFVEQTQVVYCDYDPEQCLPHMTPVLKTFKRTKVFG
jgi:hypothetical protein